MLMIKTNLYTKVALAVLAQALPYAAFAQLAQPDTIYKQTFDDEASFMTMTLVDADKTKMAIRKAVLVLCITSTSILTTGLSPPT